MAGMSRGERVGKDIQIKVKKVWAHQSSRPAVGGDISSVHCVNRRIVGGKAAGCEKRGKDRDTQRTRNAPGKELCPFSLAPS